jgi:hypothetical protein
MVLCSSTLSVSIEWVFSAEPFGLTWPPHFYGWGTLFMSSYGIFPSIFKSLVKKTAFLMWATTAAANAERVNVSGISTTMVMDHCNLNRHITNSDFCGGYIMGVFDTLAWKGTVCVSERSTTQQIMTVAVKALNEHPERWHEQPYSLLAEILTSNFPCSNATEKPN